MRRKPDPAAPDLGRFEIVIKAPTLGLVTRVPGDQPDPRAATVASNVRFDDGVIRNAPGCAPLLLNATLDSEPTLIFQANVSPSNGVISNLGAILIATSRKLYYLSGLGEETFNLLLEQLVQFLPKVTSRDMLRLQPTATLLAPMIFIISIGDDCEVWKFRTRAPSEVDDGNSFLLPFDYGFQTNNRIYVRIG